MTETPEAAQRQQLDVEYDALADDAAADKPTDQALKTIAHLGGLLVSRQRRVAELQAALEVAATEYRQTAETDLPAAMLEIGLREFVLADGQRVRIDDVLHYGIPKDRAESAYDWLRKHGHDGIIKTIVQAAFGKGEAQRASDLLEKIRDLGYEAERSESVNYQTLGKWLRELRANIAEGDVPEEDAPPDDLFGIYVRTVASIEVPPKPRKTASKPRSSEGGRLVPRDAPKSRPF